MTLKLVKTNKIKHLHVAYYKKVAISFRINLVCKYCDLFVFTKTIMYCVYLLICIDIICLIKFMLSNS